MVVTSWWLPRSTATIQTSLWRNIFPETTECWQAPPTMNWSRTHHLQWSKLLACNYPFRQQLGSLLPFTQDKHTYSWEHWENHGGWDSGPAFNSTTKATSSRKLWSIPSIPPFLPASTLLRWLVLSHDKGDNNMRQGVVVVVTGQEGKETALSSSLQ